MKITGATIENYRSIETLFIDLSAEAGCYCRILAGINESGKSNTLKAVALLSTDSKVTYSKDVNKKAKTDKKSITVRYHLDESAIAKLRENLEATGVPTEIMDQLQIDKINRVVSFDAASARTDYFHVYLKNAPDVSDYHYSVTSKAFVKASEAEAVVENVEEEVPPAPIVGAVATAITASAATAAAPVAAAKPTPVKEETLTLETKEAWEEVLELYYAKDALEPLMPRVIFWTYDDKYLINKPINLTEFAENPAAISKPLHNVFHLAQYTDNQIQAVITDALEDGALMGELADKLASTATTYLEEVWPEHKVAIKVHTANPSITFHVVEKDTVAGARYEVAERSDGFKHFFAILLNLAAENSTSQLQDCLILLDEPEIHLHPSGAKFLRDELLKIAKHNTVVYSTHSIFMIDRACLDRHYKVFKENETTQTLKIDSSNPFKEELIYEALGTSILDLISEHNILFEGLTDKKLFDAFTYKFRIDIKPLDVNAMCVDGESHFDKYCKFFNKKNIKGYIVADSDTEGNNAKNRILRENGPEYNTQNTFTINDIVQTNKKSCLEDLLPNDVLQKCIEDCCGITLVLSDNNIFKEQIADYNRSNTKKIDENKLKEFICNFVCDDITKSAMTKDKTKEKYPLYYEFVTNLHQKLKDANSGTTAA